MTGLRVGFGRAEITAYERGMGMLGWGADENVALGVEEPLFARAIFVSDGARSIAYACADLCFISAALRQRVIEKLSGLSPSEIVLSATHTHSGPSGFSDSFLYVLAGPGFSERVTNEIADGIARAIEEARARAQAASLHYAEIHIPCAEKIAFNRSLAAFHLNREVRGPTSSERAVDRKMTVLTARDARGRAIGVWSLFALHATSIHSDRQLIHSDHKGLAACELERRVRRRGGADDFVAIFAQGSAGDASPNYRFDPARGFTVGRFDDDRDSAAYVARVQVDAAWCAMERDGISLAPPIASALSHVDFGPRSTVGIGMVRGTREGPGPFAPFARFIEAAHRARRSRLDPKIPFLEVGPGQTRRIFGRIDPISIPIGHRAFELARRARAEGGGVDELAWIPTILPLSLLRIGSFGLAALPNEPTRTAGARLRTMLIERMPDVDRVEVQGYANAYSGYLTTPEEYAHQSYEGAYTLFGPNSLSAFAHAFERLADVCLDGRNEIEGPPLALCDHVQLHARRPLPLDS
jgi:neutral ceramidase